MILLQKYDRDESLEKLHESLVQDADKLTEYAQYAYGLNARIQRARSQKKKLHI